MVGNVLETSAVDLECLTGCVSSTSLNHRHIDRRITSRTYAY